MPGNAVENPVAAGRIVNIERRMEGEEGEVVPSVANVASAPLSCSLESG